ncbi:MAG: Ldh family oxidoreductase [Chloroflexi bacterium]|nr:Ldh family oxidoreductase [Chloroflexota bacterium]MDA1297213.1 Ldh family oxidoreductase [Chloroflexota bacterium]
MLEHFHVPPEDEVRVMSADLRRSVDSLFRKVGLSDDDAALATDALVSADDRGTDTHGVSNMMRRYVEMFAEGFLNPNPDVKVVRESATTANIECDAGLGLVVVPKAMEIAIEKAEKYGIGAVTMGNGRHAGMMAYHAMKALPHDMIGYAITAGGQNMVPTFGAEPRMAANPHAWAVPAGDMPPFVLDISSSSVAANKISLLRRMNKPTIPGLLAAADGSPIMTEVPVPEHTWLLPTGATREMGSHKGYGMSVVAQVFGGILSTGAFGAYGMGHMSHFVAAYKIDAFTDVTRFKSSMDDFLTYLTETPPAPGHERVYYAGLPEHEEAADRAARGIPLHKEVIEWFDSISAELNTEPLARGAVAG